MCSVLPADTASSSLAVAHTMSSRPQLPPGEELNAKLAFGVEITSTTHDDDAASEVSTAPSTPRGNVALKARSLFSSTVDKHAARPCVQQTGKEPQLAHTYTEVADLLQSLPNGRVDPKLFERICKEFRQLAREKPHSKNCIGDLGGVHAMLNSMQANSKSSEVQIAAISTLENMTAGHNKNCGLLLALGGAETILEVMAEHLDVANVQHTGCRVLLLAASSSPRARQQVIDLGAVEAAIAAMGAHHNNVMVQEAGCKALKEFAAKCEATQEKIASAGGLPAVLKAMECHQSCPQVLELACGVLRNMCSTNAEYQECVASREGIQLVLRGMKAHTCNSTVQWAGCWALLCLGIKSKEIQKEIVGHEGVEAVLAAMDVHCTDAKVQEAGCFALRDMVDHISRDVAPVGVITAVLKTMEKHPNADTVQKGADVVLRKLATRDTKGFVTPMILGRSRRIGHQRAQRALTAIQEGEESE